MPGAVGGRSYGGAANPPERGVGSNNFECGGYGGLGYVEAKDGGLRMSAIMVKGEDEDGGEDEDEDEEEDEGEDENGGR